MECNTLRISGIEPESIVDGPGFRFAVFTQGCPHACPGCHNPQTHAFSGGHDVTIEELMQQFAEDPLLSGITLSGGEPFCQAASCAELARRVHAMGGDVVTYSGYTLEQLRALAERDSGVAALLDQTDLLIDGPYIEAERDLTLDFRGSRNQRLIYLHRTDGRSSDAAAKA